MDGARVFLLALLGLAVCSGQPAWALPIVQGDLWRYWKGTAEPPPAWNQPGFDDAGWAEGPSGFGYGDGDDATVLSDMQNAYLSLYTRRSFEVVQPSAFDRLELTVDWDDGFVAYVNGLEVARRNVAGTPGTPVPHDGTATSHEAGAPETIQLSPAVLVAGTNVLAVQVHNTNLGSSDLTLIVELRATDPPPDPPANPLPPDEAVDVPLEAQLCVTVGDPGGDPLSAAFFGRRLDGPPVADFTVIALPDTQYYSQSHPATYLAQTAWIVENRVSRNVAFVSQLGDCVQTASVVTEWERADAAWRLVEDPATTTLADGIPYGIAVGNHDQTPGGDPGTLSDPGATTERFNEYFGVPRFIGRAYYGGHHGIDNDNHFELFSASGMDFIVIHMEYMPSDTTLRQDVLDWADGVLSAHPDRRAIVTSHHLLRTPTGAFSNQGQATWDALKHHHNLFLMLCGHEDQANRRYDEFTDSTGTTRAHTLVSDYQTRPNGGNGWLRILTFSPERDRIDVETWSPTVGDFIDDHPDNTAGPGRNRFALPYEMDGGPDFDEIGAASGPSGSQLCTTWSGLEPAAYHRWYAVVSDASSSIPGETYGFTTAETCAAPFAGEVHGLRFAGGAGRELSWTAEPQSALYDLAGALLAGPVTGVSEAACVLAGLAATTLEDPLPDPPAGQGYLYLIRGTDACGRPGTLGFDSAGFERAPGLICAGRGR